MKKNKVGENIRRLRSIQNLSQDNVADAIGMSSGNFGKIERGKIDVNTMELERIAKALNVHVTDFFDKPSTFTEPQVPYQSGQYATREDVAVLAQSVQLLAEKMDRIVEELSAKKSKPKKKYGKRS